jgi:hypothetical protein
VCPEPCFHQEINRDSSDANHDGKYQPFPGNVRKNAVDDYYTNIRNRIFLAEQGAEKKKQLRKRLI